jgi:NADH:ubiquinone oxidoreductase subunit E
MSTAHANHATTDNWAEVEATSKRVLGDAIVQYIGQRRRESNPQSELIGVLHKVQSQYGYLAEAHLDAVAQLMQVPAAKVAGVAGFYHYFRLTPRGKFLISVCLGTACYVKGADRVAQKLIDELGITFGETSTDGMFTLQAARCLGTCGLAPVLMVDNDVHPQVTPDQVPIILEKYLEKARKETG